MRILSETEGEMLRALYHLRYLTRDQLHRGWMSSKSLAACKSRLSVLGQGGALIERMAIPGLWVSAWRVSGRGLVELRALHHGAFEPYKPVSATFLPHLLATNDVFMALAGDEFRWECLPFAWLGSHRSGLPFKAWDRGEDGISRKRNRELRADAIVTPAATGGPRVFLELDRSTEMVSARAGRQSIESKLKTYRTYIALPAVGERRSFYAAAFGDDRPARVLFVAATCDPRRLRSIRDAAKRVAPELDVCALALDDVAGLRAACTLGASMQPPVAELAARRPAASPLAPAPSMGARPPPPPERRGVRVTDSGVRKLADFYRRSIAALARTPPDRDEYRVLRQSADRARAVLEQLRSGTRS